MSAVDITGVLNKDIPYFKMKFMVKGNNNNDKDKEIYPYKCMLSELLA